MRRCAILLILCGAATGCASMHPAGKAAFTPLTVVRDAVDAPLFTVTNVFESVANAIDAAPDPRIKKWWSLPIDLVSYTIVNVFYLLFELVGTVFGAVDYIVCRSLYPDFPKGAKVWVRDDEPWGPLYFPNTKGLWAEPSPTPTATPTPGAASGATPSPTPAP